MRIVWMIVITAGLSACSMMGSSFGDSLEISCKSIDEKKVSCRVPDDKRILAAGLDYRRSKGCDLGNWDYGIDYVRVWNNCNGVFQIYTPGEK